MKKRISYVSLIPVLFFAAVWMFGETGIYNDSHQYIAMHIHREPLYPFFLWAFRSALGEENYLEAVRFLQNALSAFSVIWLTECIRREFQLKNLMTLLVCLLQLAPHVITPVFSASALVLTNGIISEALGLPLFYLFTAQMLKMIFQKKSGAALSALLLSVLLALTRGQMMAAVVLWMVTALIMLIFADDEDGRRRMSGKRWRRIGAVLLCTALAFGSRMVLVKSYNLVFNGHFINNTFGGVGMLANVLYAADRSDGERIEDEKAREFFYLSFDLAWEKQANYSYAPDGFLNRAAHLEQYHDMLKFELIEEPWRAWHDQEGFTDYILENVESDRIARTITKSIFPAVACRWLYDYFALSACGLIRSVAVVHPLVNWFALLCYVLVIGLMGYTFYWNRRSKAVRAAAFALLAVAANVYATSMLIMCLSRYMIYGLPLFYIGGLLLLYENGARILKKEGCNSKSFV